MIAAFENAIFLKKKQHSHQKNPLKTNEQSNNPKSKLPQKIPLRGIFWQSLGWGSVDETYPNLLDEQYWDICLKAK